MSEAAAQDDGYTFDGPADESPNIEQPANEQPDEPEASVDDQGDEHEGGQEVEAQQEPRKPSVPGFSPEQQAYINEHIIARQRAKAGQFEERAQQLERELEQLRGQSQQPDDGAPAVPPMPDIWEPDYDQKVQQRDEAIAARKEWELRQQVEEQQRQYQEQQQEQQKLQALYSRVESYTQRAEKLGVESSQLQAAGNFLAQVGLPDEVTEFVLDEEHGPLITMHLAQNTADLQALSQMSPARAAVYIAQEVKPKVTRALQRRKTAPEPTEPVKGSGVPPKQRGPAGATFE